MLLVLHSYIPAIFRPEVERHTKRGDVASHWWVSDCQRQEWHQQAWKTNNGAEDKTIWWKNTSFSQKIHMLPGVSFVKLAKTLLKICNVEIMTQKSSVFKICSHKSPETPYDMQIFKHNVIHKRSHCSGFITLHMTERTWCFSEAKDMQRNIPKHAKNQQRQLKCKC